MHRLNLGALRKTVAGAVSSAAHGARDLAFDAKEALERALVAKCLRPYIVKSQIGTSGPKGLWKIYTADYRNSGREEIQNLGLREVVFIRGKSRAWEPFLDQQRAGAAHLLRLKHPGILKIIEPLEETRTQFVMVTEPIFCSLLDWITYFSSVPDIPESTRDVSFSELEIKHGLLQLSSAIGFLHNEANLAHCALGPESVLICADGHWALSNFGFSTQIDFTGSKTVTSFDFSYPQPTLEEIASKPSLQYIAPELATSRGDDMSISITASVDVFSFGLLVHSCLTRVGLLSGVEEDIGRYKTKIVSMGQMDLSVLPAPLQPFMRLMLSPVPSNRPPITAVAGCAYFQDDLLLRALQFLEGMVGKDPMQKASFLKDLEQFWKKFDVRVVRHKVLPPLLLELQNPTLQSLVIPFVFKAGGNQSKDEFTLHTLPKLKSVLQGIKGDALLTVLNSCDPLTKVMTRASVAEVLLPVFLRAFDQDVPKIQEEALRRAQSIIECLDYQELKTKVLPRINVMSMKTASAKVRINSLVLMGHLIPRLDKDEAQKMIYTCTEITKVDRSPGTLMSVLGVGDSISKHWGEEITAEMVIPFLSPLLIAKTLGHQQFSTYLTVLKDMMSRIEDKRGKQIKESEPVTANTAKLQDNQSSSNWDTGKPKTDAWDNVAQESVSWMDLTAAVSMPQSITTSQKQHVPVRAIQAGSTSHTMFTMEPQRQQVSMNSARTGSMPQKSTSALPWPTSSNTFSFNSMNGSQGMVANGPDYPMASHTAPQQQFPQTGATASLQMLDPADFGQGAAGMGHDSSANGFAAVANRGQPDFFSGMQFTQTSNLAPANTVPPSADPFSDFKPFQTAQKSNDPFADLLEFIGQFRNLPDGLTIPRSMFLQYRNVYIHTDMTKTPREHDVLQQPPLNLSGITEKAEGRRALFKMLEGIVNRGISIEESPVEGVRLLCYFRHRWLDFRLPEMEALAKTQLTWGLPFGGNTHSPFWYLDLPSLEAAHALARRSLLLKAFIQIWGEGSTFDELRESIASCPEDLKSPFYSEDVSFRVVVDGWGCKLTQKQKVEFIEELNFLPLKGPVDLKNPAEVYWLIVADPSQMTGFPGVPYRLYFGRQIAVPDLSVIQRYSLSQREYLGPTSMDAEMAFVMCNHARVKKGSLVMDPFVGTGSILVAAAHCGCVTFGCDIDVKILKQQKLNKKGQQCDIHSNFTSYGLEPPNGLIICDIHNSPFKPLEIFDAVICDPPYGVRAGSKKQSQEDAERHCTLHYTVGEMCRDLLDFSARILRIGGRLVFFCPSIPGSVTQLDIPQHPMMTPIYCCEQYLSMKYSRCLITVEKTKPYNTDEVQAFHRKQGVPVLPVDAIHDIVFANRTMEKATPPIPKFRCKQL